MKRLMIITCALLIVALGSNQLRAAIGQVRCQPPVAMAQQLLRQFGEIPTATLELTMPGRQTSGAILRIPATLYFSGKRRTLTIVVHRGGMVCPALVGVNFRFMVKPAVPDKEA